MMEFGEQVVKIEGVRYPRIKSFSGTNYKGETPKLELIKEYVTIVDGIESIEGNYLMTVEMDIANPLHLALYQAMDAVWKQTETK